MLKVATRIGFDALMVAIALFGTARTLDWWRVWTLLAVLLIIRIIGMRLVFRVHPELMRERAKSPIQHGQSRPDQALVLAVLATGFAGLPMVAGYDRFEWLLLPAPAAAVAAFGLVMFGAGWTLKSLALHANAFAVAAVRIQRERKHSVADTGIYSVVRHPFYAAAPLIFVGL